MSHSHQRSFAARRREGWGMGLYRNTRRSRLAGVCAGIADYWDVAHWVVRLLFIAAFLFTGTLALWTYLAGWLLLAPRPRGESLDGGAQAALHRPMEYDERRHDFRPQSPFRYSESASVRLERAQERLEGALRRVEAMERYVTSRRYRLNKAFSCL
ncbi:PspC domain-containing protein [Pseudohaliea rubra]|uniref:Phage shock protein C n=1 Tax=Pseudohaliea rubra DSM 19751 TaxID=1265313 RepID=A0A095XT95_9GAMM|nr:PspC domain-containing protein [Pseudohaliea rubra]KGE02891.1 Phage shock protein C [Pseudohaliea rubra DSM 19751]